MREACVPGTRGKPVRQLGEERFTLARISCFGPLVINKNLKISLTKNARCQGTKILSNRIFGGDGCALPVLHTVHLAEKRNL